MNSATHTKGPWQLARADAERCRVDIETVERGNDLPDQGNAIAVAYWGCPTEKANARLLAAAPELLAACQAVERALAFTVVGVNPTRDRLYVQVRDAIEKATGGAQ
jgi:hypothetical protein